MEMMFYNAEQPFGSHEKETEQEKQEKLEVFREEIDSLIRENDEKEEGRRNPHLSAMRPEELTDEERYWYELFEGIDFTDKESIVEYSVLADQFFPMKDRFSRKKEEEFLNQRESGGQFSPQEVMEFMAQDPRHNFYMWMANNITAAVLKKRKVIKEFGIAPEEPAAQDRIVA